MLFQERFLKGAKAPLWVRSWDGQACGASEPEPIAPGSDLRIVPHANLSGPLTIPHLYNGKNRTFYLIDYEGFRLVQATTSSQQVATAAMRQGNFAGLAPIADPLSGVPFPGNAIPAARLHPVTATLGRLYPLPNLPGAGPAGTRGPLTQNIPPCPNRGSPL